MEGKDTNNVIDERPEFERQWIKRVRGHNDRAAFKNIFNAYYNRLHAFAQSYIKSGKEAEDIVQSVFLRIWVQRESWDPDNLKNYLFKAVKNEALNKLRHKKIVDDNKEEVIRKFKDLKGSSGGEVDASVKKLRQDIEDGLDKLPPRCRQIFMLNRRSGLTYKEIAQVLDLSIGTINTQMGRALRKLRNHLSDYISILLTFNCLSDLL